ncbi:MAG: hypothetical protein KAI70_06860 [Candidatus Omnitrophica bacterium]|nr:hypothetical protein [Candidatus Omnitrophota bacterium]
MKKQQILGLMLLAVVFAVSGCADIEVPGTKQILSEPLGNPTVKIGMTKDEVLTIYGEPDLKRSVVSGEWSDSREEWYYRGRYPSLPVGASYLTEDLYLYFDGENLTTISKKSLGKEARSHIGKDESDIIK